MKLITADFETYYDKQYSLSKITTEEYIRSPLFEVIGVSVAVDDQPPVWFSGTVEATGQWLSQFDWADGMLLAHNAMFDAAILSWRFGIRPKALADTLSMGRALHGTEVGGSLKVLAEHYCIGVKGTEVENALGKHRADFTPPELARYGEYCRNDVELTRSLFYAMLSGGFEHKELKLIDLTLRMFTEPKLALNTITLIDHLRDTQNKKEALLEKVSAEKSTLMSNPQFAQYLTLLGVTPPTKISPTTGKETWAFSKNDEGFKALLEHPNEEVQALAAARIGVKSTLEETRTQRFIDIASRGLMPVPLRYYAAHTGRWGGTDSINIQNFPRKSPIKSAIIAPPDYFIVDADSSQIEARTIAWLAGQDDLVEAFAKGEDVYRIMASAIYGKPVSQITGNERFVGKTTILGAGYGMGAAKFKAQLMTFGVDLALEECERIINVYRETYPKIPALWRQAQDALHAMSIDRTAPLGREGVLDVVGKKGIRLPNGMYLKYPHLCKAAKEDGKTEYVYDTKQGKGWIKTKIYGGKLIENVCQALARIAIGEQLILVAKKYPVVMTVHDAVACLIRKNDVLEGMQYVDSCMKCTPDWAGGLPLTCEIGYGVSYAVAGNKKSIDKWIQDLQ
jgi:DNA polymerase